MRVTVKYSLTFADYRSAQRLSMTRRPWLMGLFVFVDIILPIVALTLLIYANYSPARIPLGLLLFLQQQAEYLVGIAATDSPPALEPVAGLQET